MPDLSPAELSRYARHLAIPEFGLEGQRKMRGARVLCIGAGGLGSPIALYLAAAGIGGLGLVDPDVVEITNLQRQVLFGQKDLGRKKLDAARDRLAPHLFQAERLRAQLNAVAVVALGPPALVLDGQRRFAGPPLDDVGDAVKPQLEAAQGQGPSRQRLGPPGRSAAVGLFVQKGPLGGVPILRPQPLDVDERALALAIEQVLQGGDRQQFRLAVRHDLRSTRSSVRP